MFQVWRVLMLHFVMDYRPFQSILMDCGARLWVQNFRMDSRFSHKAKRLPMDPRSSRLPKLQNRYSRGVLEFVMDARRSVSEVRGELATPKTALMALSSARPRRYSNISPGSTED